MKTELTPAAERWIRRLLRMSGMASAGFRLRVQSGGCAGLTAEFEVAATPSPGDTVWQSTAGAIYLDAASQKLLSGATVDFVDSLAQSGFMIRTPGPDSACCSPVPQLVSISTGGANEQENAGAARLCGSEKQ